MKIKKYTADTVREALLQVKDDLGADAIILKTREIKGILGQNKVEVTAALDDDSMPAPAMPDPAGNGMERRGQSAAAAYGYSEAGPVRGGVVPEQQNTQVRQESQTPQNPDASSAPSYREPQSVPANDPVEQAPKPQQPPLSSPPEEVYVPENDATESFHQSQTEDRDQPNPMQNQDQSNPMQNTGADSIRPSVPRATPQADPETKMMISGLRSEIHSLRQELREEQRRLRHQELPEEFISLFERLQEREFTARKATDLIAEIALRLPSEQRTEETITEACREVISERISVAGPITLRKNRASIVLFVGPTGVGKSTTIAKIAGDLILRQKKKVGILTTDCYRMGAVEQMQSFASAAEIALETVFDLDQIDESLDRLASCDAVLVDTAGRSRIHTEHMEELRQICSRIHADEVHLVLAANTRDRDLEENVSRFRFLGVNRLIFTKIDETKVCSALYSLPVGEGIKVSYLCSGQRIPDDLEVAQPMKIARRITEGL